MLLQGLQIKPHQNKPNRSQPRGRRHFATRIPFYANSDASFNIDRLTTSGDIEPHPGPGSGKDTNCCPVCKKKVLRNHRAISCDICQKWCHIKCGRVTPRVYREMQNTEHFDWSCPFCTDMSSRLTNVEL